MIHLILSEEPFAMVQPRRIQQVSGSGQTGCLKRIAKIEAARTNRRRNENVKRLRKGDSNLQKEFEFNSEACDSLQEQFESKSKTYNDLKRKNDNIKNNLFWEIDRSRTEGER